MSDENLKAAVNLCFVRAQVQLRQAGATLKTPNAIKGGGQIAIVADLCGEALLNRGDKRGARSAWKADMKNDVTSALGEVMQTEIDSSSV